MGIAFLMPFFIILPFAGGAITVNGESITWQEFYKRGDALILLTYGLTLLPIPYGVLDKKRWVRPFLVCFPLIQNLPVGVVAQIFNYPRPLYLIQNTHEAVRSVLFLIIWGYFAIWYLYYKDTVVDFFNGENSDSESH
ncbi:MAG: hypothetical protein AB7T38_12400 [Nitrospirales bacterium]